MDLTWIDIISDERQKEYYKQLMKFLDLEYEQKIIYPPRNNIFNAFILCPFNNIKVVILGQDPYFNGEAMGLSFSVSNSLKTPSSLKNIFKELKSDLNIDHQNDLSEWAKSGVLLLNTALTVEAGKPMSHANSGWTIFTDTIIHTISKNLNNVVFLLWGKPAQSKINLIDTSKHHIITSSHPSGLSATRTNEPFIGSKCFSRTNNYLTSNGREPIDWSK